MGEGTCMNRRQLVIDLDGTLAMLEPGSRDFADAEPNWQLIGTLRSAKERGTRIILQTARGDKRRGFLPFNTVRAEVYNEVHSWLAKHDLLCLFDEISIGEKRYGDLYIDDKGIPWQAYCAGLTTPQAWQEWLNSALFMYEDDWR